MEVSIGTKLNVSILDILPLEEADLVQYFGKPRNGKTYIASRDAIEDLNAGKVVYTNWKLDWQGYDERKNKWKVFLGTIGLKRNFFVFPKENYHYLPLMDQVEWYKLYGTDDFYTVFAKLTDCVIYLDEGHIWYDSYQMTKMPLDQRAAILHTGHFNRSIRIISQRATAIAVSFRGNVNAYIRCEKHFRIPFTNLIRFRKTLYYEQTANESVDLEVPEYETGVWGRKKYYSMYTSKYLRGDMENSQENYGEIYRLRLIDKIKILFKTKKNEKNKEI